MINILQPVGFKPTTSHCLLGLREWPEIGAVSMPIHTSICPAVVRWMHIVARFNPSKVYYSSALVLKEADLTEHPRRLMMEPYFSSLKFGIMDLNWWYLGLFARLWYACSDWCINLRCGFFFFFSSRKTHEVKPSTQQFNYCTKMESFVTTHGEIDDLFIVNASKAKLEWSELGL